MIIEQFSEIGVWIPAACAIAAIRLVPTLGSMPSWVKTELSDWAVAVVSGITPSYSLSKLRGR